MSLEILFISRLTIRSIFQIQSHFTYFNEIYVHILTGLAYRLCLQNSTWDTVINDTECRNSELTMLSNILNDILTGTTNSSMINIGDVQAIGKVVADLTNVSTGITPNELNTTNNIISSLAR